MIVPWTNLDKKKQSDSDKSCNGSNTNIVYDSQSRRTIAFENNWFYRSLKHSRGHYKNEDSFLMT